MGFLRKKKDKDYASRQSATPPIVAEYNATNSYTNDDPYDDVDPNVMEDADSALSGESKSNGGASPRNTQHAGPWFTSRQIRLFKKPPPAEQAAYSGPPRYDWVDIVSCGRHCYPW
jgi:hypothetical protein